MAVEFDEDLQVETGVPIPEPAQTPAVYPFRTMKVGDSFFLPELERGKRTIYSAASHAKRKGYGTFTVRRIHEPNAGWRVWRVA